MTEQEWLNSADATRLLAFAALRIPRSHLSLALAELVEWVWRRWHPQHPDDWRLCWMIANARATCLCESVKWADDGDQTAGYRAAQAMVQIVRWPTSTIAHPLTYGFEQDRDGYATTAGEVARLVAVFALEQGHDPRAVAVELAQLVRQQVPWPARVSRHWRPSPGLVLAGDAMLRIDGWRIADAVAATEFASLPADRAVAFDAAQATETETAEQVKHRAFLVSLDAYEEGRREPEPPSARPVFQHELPAPPLPAPLRPPPVPAFPPIGARAWWRVGAGTTTGMVTVFTWVWLGGRAGPDLCVLGVLTIGALFAMRGLVGEAIARAAEPASSRTPSGSLVMAYAGSFMLVLFVGGLVTAPIAFATAAVVRLSGYELDYARTLATADRELQRLETDHMKPSLRKAKPAAEAERLARLRVAHERAAERRAKIAARRALPTGVEALLAVVTLAPLIFVCAYTRASFGKRPAPPSTPAMTARGHPFS